jgi:predicted lipase
MLIDHHSASKLASDAYLEKQEFVNIYKTQHNKIATAITHGVRYYIIEDFSNTIIAIRGTDSIRNMITDVMASEQSFLDDESVLVHKGFYDIAKEIFQIIKLDTKKDTIIVGHSLGGAVSLLYGAMLEEKGLKNISIYTYGMPPVVNKPFLDKYKNLTHYRHFHIFDPVPSLSKPTIQLFETQKRFKAFLSSKDTISNMIDTIKNIPDKYRHHGITNTIKKNLDIRKEELEKSLFFKTCTLYFEYHKIENYIKALISMKKEYIKVEDQKIVYQVKNTIKKKHIKLVVHT